MTDREPGISFSDVTTEELRQKRGAKWGSADSDILASWVADMDFQVASEIKKVLSVSLSRDDLGYADQKNARQLAELFAVRYDLRHGLKIDPDLVLLTSDVVQAMAVCIYAFTEKGDKVVFFTPTYPPFFNVVMDLSRQVVAFDLVKGAGGYSIDFDRFEKTVAAERPKVLLLCNPHNPTGKVFTEDELAFLAEISLKYSIKVISDEIHCDLVFEGHKHIPIATVNKDLEKNTVTLSSASKTFNIAGLHCAQAAFGSKDLLDAFRNFPSILLGEVNSLGIEAAIAAYAEGASWLDAVMQILDTNRHMVEEWALQFPEAGFVTPEGTYLAWIDLRFLHFGTDLAEAVKDRAKLLLSDGRAFGKSGAGHVRVNFATSKTILEEILERLRVFITDNCDKTQDT